MREQTVLMLLADGLTTQQIAHRLQCSPRTVHKHLKRTYRKLGVRDRVNALRIAQEWKLTGHVDRPVVRSDLLSP